MSEDTMNNDSNSNAGTSPSSKVQVVKVIPGVKQLDILLPGSVHPVRIDASLSVMDPPTNGQLDERLKSMEKVFLELMESQRKRQDELAEVVEQQIEVVGTLEEHLDKIGDRFNIVEGDIITTDEAVADTADLIGKLSVRIDGVGERTGKLDSDMVKLAETRINSIENNVSVNNINIDRRVIDIHNRMNALEKKTLGTFQDNSEVIDTVIDTIEDRLTQLENNKTASVYPQSIESRFTDLSTRIAVLSKNHDSHHYIQLNDTAALKKELGFVKEQMEKAPESGGIYPTNSVGAMLNGMRSQLSAIQNSSDKVYKLSKELEGHKQAMVNLDSTLTIHENTIEDLHTLVDTIDSNTSVHEKAINNLMYRLSSTPHPMPVARPVAPFDPAPATSGQSPTIHPHRDLFADSMLTLGFDGKELQFLPLTENEAIALLKEELDSGKICEQNLTRVISVWNIANSNTNPKI